MAADTSGDRELAERVTAHMLERDVASRSLGIEIVSVAPGAATLSMTVRPDMLNALDVCHGGLLFALADTAFAFACNSRDRRAFAQHCQISFLRPAVAGDVLQAQAEERRVAGRTGLYDVTVRRLDGEVIAEFRGISRAVEGHHLG